ncbi:MAG: PepSY domain-containing protein [Methylorubrum populi]
MTRPGKRLRRWLYLGHRWLGIVTCLFFAVWFVSGVVMMYVGFPRLTEAERRAALPAIAWDRVALTPEAALGRAGLGERDARRITLSMLVDRPVYRIVPWDGPARTVSAVDGGMIAGIDPERALAAASAHPAARAPVDLGVVERDQWSVHQRFDASRPFHRIALGDEAGTQLYVSRASGEIVLDTTRRERFWNWFGAVPHWLYFTPLRARQGLWRDVILWLSGVAILGAATGLTVGLIRVRLRRRYARGAVTPYRGWMAWHHLGGLVAGTAVLTFIVSGWLSMNPNRWFSAPEPDRAALVRYAGPAGIPFPDDRAALTAACPGAVEGRFSRVDGRPVVVLACPDGRSRLCCRADALPRAALAASARRLLPDAPPPGIRVVGQEDAYWYGHHDEPVLPVLRVAFADPAATWFHIDPATGEILGRMDRSNRIQRWLFNGLHSLDVRVLVRNRPAWDALMLLLALGGLLVSVSGIVIGCRRLARPL